MKTIVTGMRKYNAPRNWHLFDSKWNLEVAGLSKSEADVLLKEFPNLQKKRLSYVGCVEVACQKQIA